MIAALNSAAVHRLHLTWAELRPKTAVRWRHLEAAMSADLNYKSPRELLSKCSPPCVPYLGIFLSDLTFVEEGNPDTLEVAGNAEPLVNFVKRRKVAEVIEKICDYQHDTYRFHEVPEIRDYLIQMNGWDDKMAYEASLQCEPRKPKK
jgi:hypothetical protein